MRSAGGTLRSLTKMTRTLQRIPLLSPWPRGALPVASFSASVLLVSVLSAIPVSPVAPPSPAGVQAPAPFRLAAHVLGLDRLTPDHAAMLAIGAMTLSSLSFLGILRSARRGDLSVRLLLIGALALHTLVTALPPLFSHDVYAYAMYGRIAAVHHSNPYVSPPAQFANDPLFDFVDELWRDQPPLYGPAFTHLAALLASALPSSASLIWAFKVLIGLAGTATLVLCAATARRVAPRHVALAVATLGWNPLFLLVATGGAHNDALVSLGVILAFRLLVRGSQSRGTPWWDAATVLILTLAVLVKVTAVLPLLLFVLARTFARRDRRSRRIFLLVAGITSAIPTAILSKPFLTLASASAGPWWAARYVTPISPAALLSRLPALSPSWLASETGRGSFRLALLLLPGIYFLFVFTGLVRGLERCGNPVHNVQGMAWGLGLACLPLASPLLFPWYVAPSLSLAWLLPQKSYRLVVAIAVLLTIPVAVIREQPFRDAYNVLVTTSSYAVAGSLLVCFVILGLYALRRPLEESHSQRLG